MHVTDTVPPNRVPSNLVRAQLGKVLSSRQFASDERLSSLLRFVAQETLAGRAADITQCEIAVQVLGCDADSEPAVSLLVRIHARRLRRALARYYGTQRSDDLVRIEIPRDGYIPGFRTCPEILVPPDERTDSLQDVPQPSVKVGLETSG